MHDFNCTEADNMNFDLMAERTRYLKENPKGVSEMCKTLEDMRNEVILEERKKIANSLLKIEKLSYEEISRCAGLALEEIKIIAAQEGLVNV